MKRGIFSFMKKAIIGAIALAVLFLIQNQAPQTASAYSASPYNACCHSGIQKNLCTPNTGNEWEYFTTQSECDNWANTLRTYGYTCNQGEGQTGNKDGGYCISDNGRIRCFGGISQTMIDNQSACGTPQPAPIQPTPTQPAPIPNPTAPPYGTCQNINPYFNAQTTTVGQTVTFLVSSNLPQTTNMTVQINTSAGGFVYPTFAGVASNGSTNIWGWTFRADQQTSYFGYVYINGALCPRSASIVVSGPIQSAGPTCSIQASTDNPTMYTPVTLTATAYATGAYTITNSEWNLGYGAQNQKSYYSFTPSIVETTTNTFYQNTNAIFTVKDTSGQTGQCQKYINVSGSGYNPTPTPPPYGNSTVTIQNYNLSPNYLTVAPGTTVTWYNQDSVGHTVASDTGGLFQSGYLSPGQSYSYVFPTGGSFGYHLDTNFSLHGTIYVTGQPSGGTNPGYGYGNPSCTVSTQTIGMQATATVTATLSPDGTPISSYNFDFGLGEAQDSPTNYMSYTYPTVNYYRTTAYVVDQKGRRSASCVSNNYYVYPVTPTPPVYNSGCNQPMQIAYRSASTNNQWQVPQNNSFGASLYDTVYIGAFYGYDLSNLADATLTLSGPNGWRGSISNGSSLNTYGSSTLYAGNYTVSASTRSGCNAQSVISLTLPSSGSVNPGYSYNPGNPIFYPINSYDQSAYTPSTYTPSSAYDYSAYNPSSYYDAQTSTDPYASQYNTGYQPYDYSNSIAPSTDYYSSYNPASAYDPSGYYGAQTSTDPYSGQYQYGTDQSSFYNLNSTQGYADPYGYSEMITPYTYPAGSFYTY